MWLHKNPLFPNFTFFLNFKLAEKLKKIIRGILLFPSARLTEHGIFQPSPSLSFEFLWYQNLVLNTK